MSTPTATSSPSMDDEAMYLSWTWLSLPTHAPTSYRFLQPSRSPTGQSPSLSAPSDVTAPPVASCRSVYNGDERPLPRRFKSVRKGLSNLPTPPCPFGSQLEPETTRKASLPPSEQQDHFDLRPPSHASDNDSFDPSRTDPVTIFHSLVSAWDAVKALGLSHSRSLVAMMTEDSNKASVAHAATVGLCIIAICRPRWILTPLALLRDPHGSYRSALYSLAMSMHGIYHPML